MPWCYKLLRAARAGRGNASSKTSEVSKVQSAASGAGATRPDSDKENAAATAQEEKDTDIPFGPRGTKRGATQGFAALRWMQVPKTQESPDREHLAKRRKGLAATHAIPDPSTTAHMRKTKVRRTDAEGQDMVFEVMVPKGTKVEGEIKEEVTLENAAAAIAAPKAGTVVQGLGVANEAGVVIATQGIAALESRKKGVPVPRRKKKKGGPGKWQVKLSDMTTGGVSASAEALEERKRAEAGLNAGGPKTEAEKQAAGEEDEGESEEDGEEGDDDREEGELSDTPAQDAGAGAEEPMLLDEPHDTNDVPVKPPETTTQRPDMSITIPELRTSSSQPQQQTQLSPHASAQPSIPGFTSPRPHPRIPGLTASESRDDGQRTSAPPVKPPPSQQQSPSRPSPQPERASPTADADSDDDPYASYTEPTSDAKPKPSTTIEASAYPEYDSDPYEEPHTTDPVPEAALSKRNPSPIKIAEDTTMTDAPTVPQVTSKSTDGTLAEVLQVPEQPISDTAETTTDANATGAEQHELQSAEQEEGATEEGREEGEDADPADAQIAEEGEGESGYAAAELAVEDEVMGETVAEMEAVEDAAMHQDGERVRPEEHTQKEDNPSLAKAPLISSSIPPEPPQPQDDISYVDAAPVSEPAYLKGEPVAPSLEPSEPQQMEQAQPFEPEVADAVAADTADTAPEAAPDTIPEAFPEAGVPPQQAPEPRRVDDALPSNEKMGASPFEEKVPSEDINPHGETVPTEDGVTQQGEHDYQGQQEMQQHEDLEQEQEHDYRSPSRSVSPQRPDEEAFTPPGGSP